METIDSNLTRHRPSPRRRRGLSTLELCLVLPLLMFLCALLIYAGTTFVWQVRGLGESRHAVWKTRGERWVYTPDAVSWPEPGTSSMSSAPDYNLLDLGQLDQPVARGPLPGADVNRDLLDPSLRAIQGNASMSRTLQMPPRDASISFHLQHAMLDNSWTYNSMGMGSNTQRRVPVIYQLETADEQLVQTYVDTVVEIYYGDFQEALVPLDREPDFPRFGKRSPDFHPRVSSFCELDRETVYEGRVVPLVGRPEPPPPETEPPAVVGRISQVPKTMASSYLNLYQGELARLESLLESLRALDPPADPAAIAAVERELDALHAELDPLIAQLQAFLGSL